MVERNKIFFVFIFLLAGNFVFIPHFGESDFVHLLKYDQPIHLHNKIPHTHFDLIISQKTELKKLKAFLKAIFFNAELGIGRVVELISERQEFIRSGFFVRYNLIRGSPGNFLF